MSHHYTCIVTHNCYLVATICYHCHFSHTSEIDAVVDIAAVAAVVAILVAVNVDAVVGVVVFVEKEEEGSARLRFCCFN